MTSAPRSDDARDWCRRLFGGTDAALSVRDAVDYEHGPLAVSHEGRVVALGERDADLRRFTRELFGFDP